MTNNSQEKVKPIFENPPPNLCLHWYEPAIIAEKDRDGDVFYKSAKMCKYCGEVKA